MFTMFLMSGRSWYSTIDIMQFSSSYRKTISTFWVTIYKNSGKIWLGQIFFCLLPGCLIFKSQVSTTIRSICRCEVLAFHPVSIFLGSLRANHHSDVPSARTPPLASLFLLPARMVEFPRLRPRRITQSPHGPFAEHLGLLACVNQKKGERDLRG